MYSWAYRIDGFLLWIHNLIFIMCYRCFIEELDFNVSNPNPIFNVSELSQYIPLEDDHIEKCLKYDPQEPNRTIGCGDKYVYDLEYHKESRVISVGFVYYNLFLMVIRMRVYLLFVLWKMRCWLKWDLVCDLRWERALIQTIYILGVLVGAIVLGPMADK